MTGTEFYTLAEIGKHAACIDVYDEFYQLKDQLYVALNNTTSHDHIHANQSGETIMAKMPQAKKEVEAHKEMSAKEHMKAHGKKKVAKHKKK